MSASVPERREADLFGACDRVTDDFGEFDAGGVVGEEGRAAFKLFVDDGVDFGVAMADQHRAGADQEIDELTAVFVPDSAGAAFAKYRVAGDVTETCRRAARLRRAPAIRFADQNELLSPTCDDLFG